MIKIGICDDERKELEYLKEAAEKWGEKNSVSCEISTFPSAEAFLFEYERDNSYDILLFDIEMPGMDGIALAKKLRMENNLSEIIFITSHFEFYGEGYEVDALHYLIKPVDICKLEQVLSKAAERIQTEPASVVFTADGSTMKIYEKDILYVEALLHYVVIHTRKEEYRLRENLSEFAKKLSGDFFQTHRSYYVSLKHIVKISRTSVTLDNDVEIPLARRRR